MKKDNKTSTRSVGTLFIVAAPSGTGKTSLTRTLAERLSTLLVSVSHTTRPPRPSENHGVSYYFLDEPSFVRMVRENMFLEHAHVFGHWYGTSKQWVEQQLQAGNDVILEIDWQGAQQVRSIMPDTVNIFIAPPTLSILRERLTMRGQDTQDVVEKRLQKATQELAHYQDFDFIIINDEFELALENLNAIIQASHLDRRRSSYNEEFLKQLMADLDHKQ